MKRQTQRSPIPFTKLLTDIRAADIDAVGGKGANLGELAAAGFPVPPAFCVTTSAFRMFMYDSPRVEEIYSVLGRLPADDLAKAQEVGTWVRRNLSRLPIPEEVQESIHASSPAEALSRLCSAFAPDIQAAVQAQLASCLVAVISQRLVHDRDLGIRLPELEILVANDAVRAAIRSGQLHRLQSAMQTGAADGMWTFERYRRWMEQEHDHFVVPGPSSAEPLPAEDEALQSAPLTSRPRTPRPRAAPSTPPPAQPSTDAPVLVLDDFDEDLDSILSELD